MIKVLTSDCNAVWRFHIFNYELSLARFCTEVINPLIARSIKFRHFVHVPAQYIRIKRHLAKDRIGKVDVARRMNGQVIG